MAGHRIFATSFASIYPLYVTKAERKDRSKDEVDQVICWLTGYDVDGLERTLATGVDLETFFAEAPHFNPNAALITGMICGLRVEDIEDPLMQKIRYLDKLVDELARGKKLESILRAGASRSWAAASARSAPRSPCSPSNPSNTSGSAATSGTQYWGRRS